MYSRSNLQSTPGKQQDISFESSSQIENKKSTAVQNVGDVSSRSQSAELEQINQQRQHVLTRFKARLLQEPHKILFFTSVLMFSYPIYKLISLLQKPDFINIAIFIVLYSPVCFVVTYVFCRHYSVRSFTNLPSTMPEMPNSQLIGLKLSDPEIALAADIKYQFMTTELTYDGIFEERTSDLKSGQLVDINAKLIATKLIPDNIDKERTSYLKGVQIADIKDQIMSRRDNIYKKHTSDSKRALVADIFGEFIGGKSTQYDIYKERLSNLKGAQVADIENEIMAAKLRSNNIYKERSFYKERISNPKRTLVADNDGKFIATKLRQDNVFKERTLELKRARAANIKYQVMDSKLRNFSTCKEKTLDEITDAYIPFKRKRVSINKKRRKEYSVIKKNKCKQVPVDSKSCKIVEIVESKSRRSLLTINTFNTSGFEIAVLSKEAADKDKMKNENVLSDFEELCRGIYRHNQNHATNRLLQTNIARFVSFNFICSEYSPRESLLDQHNNVYKSELTNISRTSIQNNFNSAQDTGFRRFMDTISGSMSMEISPHFEQLLNGRMQTDFDGTLVRSDGSLVREMDEYYMYRKNRLTLNVITSLSFSTARYSSDLHHTKLAFSAIHFSEYRMPLYFPVALDGLINQKDQRDRRDHLLVDRRFMYSLAYCESYRHTRESAFIYDGNSTDTITVTDIPEDWQSEDFDSN